MFTSETERLVKFHLLGQDFAFYTGASEAEMDTILALVRKQVEEYTTESGGTIPVSKVAVMACLNLASRYVKIKQDFDDYRKNSEVRIGLVNEKIEQHFSLGKIDES